MPETAAHACDLGYGRRCLSTEGSQMRALVAVAIAVVAGAGPALAAPDLADYAGKYPSDAVGGTTLLDHPVVIAGVEQAVRDVAVRDWVLSPETVQSPIAVDAGMLLSQACEPHNCGDHTWTILIHIETGATDVCYHDAAEMGFDESRWYLAQGQTEMRPGLCPAE
jgi:hypothetical protein